MYTSTPEQKAKAKERRERIQDLTRRIARMSEAERAALVHGLATTIEGHTLSMTNQMLIAYQSVGQQQVTIWLPCSTSLRLKRWGNETDKTAHIQRRRSCGSTRLYRSPGGVPRRVDGFGRSSSEHSRLHLSSLSTQSRDAERLLLRSGRGGIPPPHTANRSR